jgi:methionine synthase II (cobalamin-independent)
METTVLGYPQIGPSGELKLAAEAFRAGRETCAGLTERAAALRRQVWETLRDAGLSDIPSNTFSLFDHVLDTAVLFNAVPERFAALEGLDAYFAMARGADGIAPLELTKWLNTDYCYLAPELGPETDLRLAGHKPLFEYLQARSYGVQTRPVLLGPLSFLLLAKPAAPGFSPLDLLDPLLDAYAQLLEKLQKAGAEWVQLDEPALAADRTGEELAALRHAYHRLGSLLRRPVLLVSTSSGEIGDALPVLAASPVEAIGLDFVAGPGNREALAAIGGIGVKTLVAGVIDGRSARRADLPAALSLCASLFGLAGNLIVSTSCSLLNEPLDLAAETALAADLTGRLAFARQTVDEVVALGRALSVNDAFAAAASTPYAIRLPCSVRHGGRGLRVGRAHRLVVGWVGGPGLASVRVHLLIRVQPVVAPVGGRLAAHGAGDDLRAWDRNAVALGPPDSDPDHDRECGNVNHGHQRGDEGQVGAHLDAVLRGCGQGGDAGPAGCTVECREAPVQLLKFAEAHAELRHDRGRNVERLLA